MDAGTDQPDEPPMPARGDALDILFTFLKLGMTSFGGPIAHIAYFRHELVLRRQWLSEAAYTDIVALCQLLPGPTSSQVGFAIGLQRGGVPCAFAAFAGFTAPSAVLIFAGAAGLPLLSGALSAAVIHGLTLVAVSVVAQAVLGMALAFCRTPATGLIAFGTLALMLTVSAAWVQPAVIVGAGIVGLLVLPRNAAGQLSGVHAANAAIAVPIGMFVLLLIGLPVLAAGSSTGVLAIADVFYRAGAFVFGGGHVVLPLLEAGTVARGWMDEQTFLAGYGVAQALPGPLFTFAGYLGVAGNTGVPPFLAGPLALAMIFLPGFLLVAAVLPLWRRVRMQAGASAFVGGANAAVVGLLAAALWDPVIKSAVLSPFDLILAAVGFLMLQVLRASPLVVVLAMTGGAVGGAFLFP